MARGRKRLIAGCGLVAFGVAVAGVFVASRWYRAESSNDATWGVRVQRGNVQLRWKRWERWWHLDGRVNYKPVEFPTNAKRHSSIRRLSTPELRWNVRPEIEGHDSVASCHVLSVVHGEGAEVELRDEETHLAIAPSQTQYFRGGNPDASFLRARRTEVAIVWNVEVMLWPIALVALAAGVPLVMSGRKKNFRAREGLCLACGYNLAGLASGAVCPECGKAR